MNLPAQTLDIYKEPVLIHLQDNLYMVSFYLMKLLPALKVMEQALRDGRVIPGKTTLIESSSGSFALALALIAKAYHLPLHIVAGQYMDQGLYLQLRNRGTHVHIVDTQQGGIQKIRIQKVKELLQEIPHAFWPNQYDNLTNALAYGWLGEWIQHQLGNELILVGAVSTGGSTCGTIKPLRAYHEATQLVGVDIQNSVLFGQPDGKRDLEGFGNSIMPQNLEHALFDEVHWVTTSEAYYATKALHQAHGYFGGVSTGACYMVANYLAQKSREKVVFISPDRGDRYVGKAYNNAWLKQNGFFISHMPDQPVPLSHYSEPMQQWSCFPWQRRNSP